MSRNAFSETTRCYPRSCWRSPTRKSATCRALRIPLDGVSRAVRCASLKANRLIKYAKQPNGGHRRSKRNDKRQNVANGPKVTSSKRHNRRDLLPRVYEARYSTDSCLIAAIGRRRVVVVVIIDIADREYKRCYNGSVPASRSRL